MSWSLSRKKKPFMFIVMMHIDENNTFCWLSVRSQKRYHFTSRAILWSANFIWGQKLLLLSPENGHVDFKRSNLATVPEFFVCLGFLLRICQCNLADNVLEFLEMKFCCLHRTKKLSSDFHHLTGQIVMANNISLCSWRTFFSYCNV